MASSGGTSSGWPIGGVSPDRAEGALLGARVGHNQREAQYVPDVDVDRDGLAEPDLLLEVQPAVGKHLVGGDGGLG